MATKRYPWVMGTFLVAATAVFSACAPAAAPPTAAPAKPAQPVPAAEKKEAPAAPAKDAAAGKAAPAGKVVKATAAEWNTIVEAAKKEGVVKCACPPRPDFWRTIKEGFETAVPGIKVEVTEAAIPEFYVRAQKEQDAGQFLYDVYTFGPGPDLYDIANKGYADVFWNYMVGPDVGTDADWDGGLAGPFLDTAKQRIFGYWRNITTTASINRKVLPNAKISKWTDLLDPQYKGRVVWQDPRAGGAGQNFVAAIYKVHGRDVLKKSVIDQEPMFVKGQTELAEQLIRGNMAVSIPDLSEDTLIQYRNAGVDLGHIEETLLEDILTVSHGGSSPIVWKNPPNPNATKVFINWLLSKQGQELLATKLKNNSMRKDVAPGEPGIRPQAGKEYIDLHSEDNIINLTREAQRIVRELLG